MNIRLGKTHSSCEIGSWFIKWSQPGKYGCRLLREYSVYLSLANAEYQFIPWPVRYFFSMGFSCLILPAKFCSGCMTDFYTSMKRSVQELHSIQYPSRLGFGWIKSNARLQGEYSSWEKFLQEYVSKYLNRLDLLEKKHVFNEYIQQVCLSITSPHSGVIHRDLKEANWLFVLSEGQVYLIDWENAMLVPSSHIYQIEAAMYAVTYGIENDIFDILFNGMVSDNLFRIYGKIFNLGAMSFSLEHNTDLPRDIDELIN